MNADIEFIFRDHPDLLEEWNAITNRELTEAEKKWKVDFETRQEELELEKSKPKL
jgi:hypothetical protein